MGLNSRVKRLESQTGTNPVDLEARRRRADEKRKKIRATIERVLEEERCKGNPEPSEEEVAAATQELRQALRRKAGLE